MAHPGSGLESQNLAEATLLREACVWCVLWDTWASQPEAIRTLQVHVGGMVCPRILPSDTDVRQSVTPSSGKERWPELLPSVNTLWGGSTVLPKARGNSRWALGPDTSQ